MQVERHAAVQQSLGRVTFKGLLDADRRFELERMMDVNGDKQQPVTMSVRDVLMGWKGERGVRLFQTIALREDGNWDGFYTAGERCESHRDLAPTIASCLAANIKYHLLKRGVEIESIMHMIKKCFTQAAMIEAENAKLVDGVVLTESRARLRKKLAKMEGPNSWLDITLGMSKKQKEEYELAQASKEVNAMNADVDPKSREAFNFDEELTVVRKKRDDASQYTKNEAETLGGTAYDPPEDSEAGQSTWGSEESDIWEAGDEQKRKEDQAEGGQMARDEEGGIEIENIEDLAGMASGAKTTGETENDYEAAEKDLKEKMAAATEKLDLNASISEEFKDHASNENKEGMEEEKVEQLTLERMLEAKAGASKEDKIRLLQEALARLGGIPETVEPTEQSVSGPPDEGTLLRSQSQPDNPTGQTAEGAVPGADAVGYDKGAVGTAEAGRSPD